MPSKSRSKKKKSSGNGKGKSHSTPAASRQGKDSNAKADDCSKSHSSPLSNDPRFLKEYSKSLADALRENEELPPPPPAQLVGAAYRAMCHDEPRIEGQAGGDGSCRLLAERLVTDAFGDGAFVARTETPGAGEIDALGSGLGAMTMKRRGGGARGAALTAGRPAAPKSPTRPDPLPSAPLHKAEVFALSDRLIGGILQATDRTNRGGSGGPVSPSEVTDKEGDLPSTSGFVPSGQFVAATPSGYSELAYAAFVRGPLLCCRSSTDIGKVRAFLGSYSGHRRVPREDGRTEKDKASQWEDDLFEKAAEAYIEGMRDLGNTSRNEEQKEEEWDSIGDESDGSSSSSGFFVNQQKHQRIADTNSIEEVWAEESDPDDFQYESAYDAVAESAAAAQAIDECFDPSFMSKPNADLDFVDAEVLTSCLLEELTYNRLFCISKKRWSELGVTEALMELTKVLLEADSGELSNAGKESLLGNPSERPTSASVSNLKALWSKPLSVLNERALDESHDHDAFDAYLDFVRSLLSSPECRRETPKPDPKKIVGLSSLSSLCGHNGILRTKSNKTRIKLRQGIIESIDGIIDLLEAARQPSTSGQNVSRDLPSAFISDEEDTGTAVGDDHSTTEWIRVAIYLLPLLEYLTSTKISDHSRLDGKETQTEGLTSKEAQSILSTGLFRELILLLSSTGGGSMTSEAVLATRSHLLRAIFIMSAQSPTILGKYSSRVPDIVSEVYSEEFRDGNFSESTLWSALGASLASSGPKSTLKLKGVAVPPSIDGLRGDCVRGFVALCDRVEEAFDLVPSENKATTKDLALEKARYDFVEFTNCIANLPAIAAAWRGAVALVDGGEEKVRQRLLKIRSCLSRVPAKIVEFPPPSREEEEEKKDKSPERHEEKDGKKDRDRAAEEEIIAATRKGVKIITLLLESGPSPERGTAAVYALSSKTD